MTFYNFMIRNYLTDDSPKGDLARDMKRDKVAFPKNDSKKYRVWHDLIYIYLMRCEACDDALAIFEICWKEYVLCEKNI